MFISGQFLFILALAKKNELILAYFRCSVLDSCIFQICLYNRLEFDLLFISSWFLVIWTLTKKRDYFTRVSISNAYLIYVCNYFIFMFAVGWNSISFIPGRFIYIWASSKKKRKRINLTFVSIYSTWFMYSPGMFTID